MGNATSGKRFQSLADFWPHYLSQHRVAADRGMHFMGTAWMFGCVAAALIGSPVRMVIALTGMVLVGWYASTRVERRRPAFAEMVVLYVLAVAGHPVLMTVGIAGAYFLSWCGHYGIEHNKPAAFRYPVWSLVSDLRMTAMMAGGRLWSGDPFDDTRLARAKPAA